MSQKSLEEFLEKVGSDDELRGSIESQLDNDGNISVDALIAFGADNGCDFTVDDLEGAAELSDEELDGVAGGISVVIVGTGVRGSKVITGGSSTRVVGWRVNGDGTNA